MVDSREQHLQQLQQQQQQQEQQNQQQHLGPVGQALEAGHSSGRTHLDQTDASLMQGHLHQHVQEPLSTLSGPADVQVGKPASRESLQVPLQQSEAVHSSGGPDPGMRSPSSAAGLPQASAEAGPPAGAPLVVPAGRTMRRFASQHAPRTASVTFLEPESDAGGAGGRGAAAVAGEHGGGGGGGGGGALLPEGHSISPTRLRHHRLLDGDSASARPGPRAATLSGAAGEAGDGARLLRHVASRGSVVSAHTARTSRSSAVSSAVYSIGWSVGTTSRLRGLTTGDSSYGGTSRRYTDSSFGSSGHFSVTTSRATSRQVSMQDRHAAYTQPQVVLPRAPSSSPLPIQDPDQVLTGTAWRVPHVQ
jgi:hypothetical protein